MSRSRIFSALFLLLALTLACAIPSPSAPPTTDVNAIVTQTIAALTASAPAPITPSASPPTPSLLPSSLYFLAPDAAAHAQVFRLEADGKTVKQITAEPAEATAYDVNLTDGRVVYISNNQMFLINRDGSGRQMILDGGTRDEINPFLNSLQSVAWSPNGATIAYGYQGLNLYSVATGASNRVLENQIRDAGGGFLFPEEMYWPDSFSPDGTKLLVTLGYYEGASAAIYYPASDSLVRLSGAEGALICCGEPNWTADSAALFTGNPSLGMYGPGLWRVDAATGKVTTLLPGDAGNGTFNFADEPFLAPDGQLYFFFANLPSSDEFMSRTPLQLVRSAPDGVTGRTILLPATFEMMTEALWSPDASFVIVTIAQNDQTWQGGQAEVVYVDGRPRVVLVPFAQGMKWGP
jgi:Tol biopolymer transport system component